MNFLKLSSPLIATTSLLISILPANAGLPDLSKAADPIAACKDVNVGTETVAIKISESGSSKIHTIEDIKDIDEYKSTSEVNNESSNKKSGGGKLFGAGGKYSSESSTKNSENLEVINKTDDSVNIDSSSEESADSNYEQSISKPRVGKDCDGIAESISKVQMNRSDNEMTIEIAEKKLEAKREETRAVLMKDLLKF